MRLSALFNDPDFGYVTIDGSFDIGPAQSKFKTV